MTSTRTTTSTRASNQDKRTHHRLRHEVRDPRVRPRPVPPTRSRGGAPNVLVILLDGAGFGAATAFGGPVRTPTAERLAASGLRYTRFHTAAMGPPTRAALLTGRNQHSAGISAAPLAEILRRNGYSTAQFGSCHEAAAWAPGAAVPYQPESGVFARCCGAMDAETDRRRPLRAEGAASSGGHLVSELADTAIEYLRTRRHRAPDTPFFACFAPGAAHAQHVPEDVVGRYRGRFDGGWDALRADTFARQRELGVIDPGSVLTPRPDALPAWDDVAEEWKPALRRRMEVAAASLEYADRQAGRVVDALEETGLLADTLVVYMVGAPSDTGPDGVPLPAAAARNGEPAAPHPPPDGPDAAADHAAGWAHALCTPYRWTREGASHYGGTRNATIVHWPKGIEERGGLRHQWHHVIDIAPTVLELAGITPPETVDSVPQAPMHGTSLAYSFNAPDAAERHHTQYFELMGDRAIYDQGWTAVTKHPTPWDALATGGGFSEDAWELYDTRTDWTQARDLSKEHPEKLAELQLKFIIEASRFDVFPRDEPPWGEARRARRAGAGRSGAVAPGDVPAQRERHGEALADGGRPRHR